MLVHPLNNNRGVALLFMVLFFTAAATASIMFIAMGLKVKGIQQEGTTQQRLAEIRTALQNYYLIHYDLPDPSTTTPQNSVPTALLNLPQKYRFDNNGQQIHYDRFDSTPPPSLVEDHMTTVQNISVEGALVAAVLIAPGPNKVLDASTAPYTNVGNDDLVVAVSLEAEALKIANHAVAVLQQAAKAYDAIFYEINNDADTLFLPPVDSLNNDGTWEPGTEWYDYTEPVQQIYEYISAVNGGYGQNVRANGEFSYYWIGDTDIPPDGINDGSYNRQDGTYLDNWYPNYAGTALYTNQPDGLLHDTGGVVPGNDEDISPRPILNPQHQSPSSPPFPVEAPTIDDANMRPLERPVPLIDEGELPIGGVTYDSYVEAKPNLYVTNPGQGCVQLGILSNDPSRGTASLDNCSSGTPAYDLAVAYGLNLVKLGYDPASNQLLDPWGNQYLWGASGNIYPHPLYDPIRADLNNDGSYDQTDDVLREPHYWTFYSLGPDGLPALGADGRPNTGDENTPDDILPPADRIPGYFTTPRIPNPIP